MGFRICIDIGGTFTDCVMTDRRGRLTIFKAPSTPGAFEQGFMDVLAIAARAHDLSLETFLAQTESIVHGSTVSTNALVEGKAARVGFITNEGFPDILTLREAPRKRSFSWRLDYPEPYVPRERTATVRGRIDSRGNELTPLHEADVAAAVDRFRRLEVEAIAVCLLWSIVDGAHERRVRELIRGDWPDVPITLSHELNPIPREYRRAVSTCIDASLHPVVSDYVARILGALDAAKFTGSFLLANCVGGMMPPEEIVKRPIYSVMSGPTLAPIAAQRLTSEPDVIVVDMGGTTFDVSAIRSHQLVISAETMIGNDMLGIPKVDVRSIGAGGGSIAWVDVAGLLRVGPQSAGARPGPACYGTGGTEPTVTDANVVLGIIDPDYFLGGRIKLDRSAAEAAVGKIAAPLGIDLVDAAYAIHTTSNHNMITAIEDVTIREGINPRDSYLVSGGGATACHIGEMARVLGIDRFMIPKFSAGLSAFGGLFSDVRWEETATLHTDHRAFDFDAINRGLASLQARGAEFLESAGVAEGDRRYEYAFYGRYRYQSWEIEVPFVGAPIQTGDLETLVQAFHDMHERIYTIRDDDELVEFTTWKVRAIGANQAGDTATSSVAAGAGLLAEKARRAAYVHEAGGMIEVPVYEGASIDRSHVVRGPAIIEEETFTTLLLNDQEARVGDTGDYLVMTAT